MLERREHYCNFDGETNKNVTVQILKKHMVLVNITSLFSSLCSTVAPNIQGTIS